MLCTVTDVKRDVFKLTPDEVSGLLRKLGLNKVRAEHKRCDQTHPYTDDPQAFGSKFKEDEVNGMFLMSMQEDWLEPYARSFSSKAWAR